MTNVLKTACTTGWGRGTSAGLFFSCVIGVISVIGPFSSQALAQSYLTSTGISSFSVPEPAEMGTVDAASGNLHLEIPLGSFTQRGGSAPLVPRIIYDSHIWTLPTDGTSHVWTPTQSVFALPFGSTWSFDEGGSQGIWPGPSSGSSACNFDYLSWDQSGVQHWFNIAGTWNGAQCSGGTAYAADSSGFQLRQTAWGSGVQAHISLYAPDGTEVYGSDLDTAGVASKDSNGNYLGLTTTGSLVFPGVWDPVIDTVGRTVVNTIQNGNPTILAVRNSQGTTSTYVINLDDVPVKTNFQQSGITECTNSCTVELITSITLPDGTSYSFRYDCDSSSGHAACNSPAGQSAYYGTLTSMTMPTGGMVSYTYSNFKDALGGVSHWLTSKYSYSGYWSYAPAVTGGSSQNVTVVKPDYSQEVISFTVDPSGGAWPIQTLSYDTNGTTLLSTVKNTWDFSVACTLNACGGQGHQDVRKLSTSATFPVPGGSITKKTAYAYDSPQTGNLTAVKEWKYQPGTSPTFPSTPDRGTYTTYATIGSNNNINRPSSITVCNNVGTNSSCTGGGTPVAQTTIIYDGYGRNGSSALQSITLVINHDDTYFGTSYLTRGNATQINRWIGGSTYLTTAFSYDMTGQVTKVVDPNGNPTSYSYTDAVMFYDDNGSGAPPVHSGAPKTNAYVTTVTDAIGSTSMGYYYGSGQMALSTDYDGVTTYGHYADPFGRPTKTDYPIGWALNVYGVPAQGQTQVDSYAAVGDTNSTGSANCTLCTHTQALLDQLGRAVTANVVNNPAGEATVTSVYDGFNRVSSTSHPYIGTSDPNNVYENTYYDGLGRSVRVTHPDGQSARVAFGAKAGNLGGLTTQWSSASTYGYGFPVVSMDEAGKQRQEWIDGFGHVIEVDEPSTNTAAYATATITVTGSEGSTQHCDPANPDLCHTVWDSGYLTVTVNGFVVSAYWGKLSTAPSVAASLASGLNSPESPVTATVNGTAVTMTAGGPGAYSISFSQSFLYNDFLFTPASGTFTGGSGGILSSPNVTTYIYDVLGNLTGVTQGAQNRSYQYDTLSRLTQEITPEVGKVTLSYGTPGSLCSGDASKPCSRTAPAPNQTGTATVTTTYTYNTANQLKQKTHSDTTGTETYAYGTSPSSFNVGRLITMTDPSGSEAYTYDQIGRLKKVSKTIGSTIYATQYGYNAGSELTSITYPSGRVVDYNYDNVGDLCQVATSLSTQCNATTSYLTLPSSSYDAAGQPLSATYGNGVVATAVYSPQTFELTSLGYAKGTTTLLGLNYYYQQNSTYCPTGSTVGNNGQIQCIADVSSGTGDSGRSAAYTYDSLGRLFTAKTTGSTQYPAWGLSWIYDRYANRTAQTVTAGSGYNVSLSINAANNQITGYTYDASGNITAYPSNAATFVYDGEECDTGYTGNGNTATYTCDGNHVRVKKAVTGTNAVTTVSIRSGGQVIAEYDNGAAVTSPTREYLYGDSLLAIVTGSTGGSGGTVIYQHGDHLSPRLYTDVSGNDVGEQGTFPFGESWYNNNTTSSWVFTSYERDKESGNDYALARSYANSQGRFLTPDPLEGVVGDPQSWNRYAYVENDPVNFSDPNGQGFWEDLGFAIVDIFLAIIPGGQALLPYAFGAESGQMTAQQITGCTFPCIWVTPDSHGGVSNKGVATPCPQYANCTGETGPGSGGSASDPASTGENPDGSDPGSQGPGGNGTASPGSGSPGAGGGGGAPGGSGRTISNPSGGDIWNECDACWRTVAWAGNFSAGAGDIMTAGLTIVARKGVSRIAGMGYGDNVNYRSGAYWSGAGTGAVLGTVIAPYFAGPKSFLAKSVLNNNRFVRLGWNTFRGSPTYRLVIGAAGAGLHAHLDFTKPAWQAVSDFFQQLP